MIGFDCAACHGMRFQTMDVVISVGVIGRVPNDFCMTIDFY